MSALKIDHVTIAGNSLERLQRSFAEIGLKAEYGGLHSNQITHMAFLGFDNGSYVELISVVGPGEESPWWHQHIVQDGGPCAWSVQVSDISRQAETIAARGVPVRGPSYHYRERPDGKLVEWDLAFLGDHEPGAKLPFLISDRTPRSIRVQPSPSILGSDLFGVRKVVLAVEDISAATQLFRRVFDWQRPRIESHPDFGARLAAFESQPVILAVPIRDNWLRERLNVFGEGPCGYLIGSRDFEASLNQRKLALSTPWFQHQVAWFDPDRLNGTRLGVIGI